MSLNNSKKLQSSKSDSYHQKYIWDMVFNERAVIAIQEEFRLLKKNRSGHRSGNSNSRSHGRALRNRHNLAKRFNSKTSNSAASGDDCSQNSSNLGNSKVPMSAAAAAAVVNNMHDILLRSASQRGENSLEQQNNHTSNNNKEKRKISQTGSSLFAHVDARIKDRDRMGRHPAKSSSKEGSEFNRHQHKSGSLLRRGVLDRSPKEVSDFEVPRKLSLKNNENSVGGTDSSPYQSVNGNSPMNSGQSTGLTSVGYPGYPSIPYMDPMMIQAFMIQGLFNPMMLAATTNLNANSTTSPYTSAYPSMSGYIANMSSSSGGYPNVQQDLINQMNNNFYQNLYPNKNNNNTMQDQSPSRANFSPKLNSSKKKSDSEKESSEESEDIRPSRHAIDDQFNDLHPIKHSRKNKEVYKHRHRQSSINQHESRMSRTKAVTAHDLSNQPGLDSNFADINVTAKQRNQSQTTSQKLKTSNLVENSNPTSNPKPHSKNSKSMITYLTQLKSCVETLKLSGWYWGNITGENAMSIVEKQGLGAFLIRDSTHQKFLFTLTVHTSNGPTNVRIVYKQGLFGLDCDSLSQTGVKFDCVVKMINHYVNNSKKYKRLTHKKQKQQATGLRDSNPPDETTTVTGDNSIALLLLLPCRKTPASLKHLARMSIYKKLSKKSSKLSGLTLEHLVQDPDMLEFCREYPYTV